MIYTVYIVLIAALGYSLYKDIQVRRRNNKIAYKIFKRLPCSHCTHCEFCKANGRGHLDVKCDVILMPGEDKVTFNDHCPYFDNIEKEI